FLSPSDLLHLLPSYCPSSVLLSSYSFHRVLSSFPTRRSSDLDVIMRDDDCGTDRGITVSAIMEGDDMIEPLFDRLVGRFTAETVKYPKNGEAIVGRDVMMDENMGHKICDAGVTHVKIRSILTCDTPHGVCRKCYGMNLATGEEVEVGEAVGTVAAQSIGEPGTQLTLRTFHNGG